MHEIINRDVKKILREYQKIAVVGISDKNYRDSFNVASFMQSKGYHIIPVIPRLDNVLGERCYPSLRDIPEEVGLVDIFRRSEFVEHIVDEAIEIGAKAVWM